MLVLWCRLMAMKTVWKRRRRILWTFFFQFLRVAQGLEENYLSSFVDVVGNVG